MIIVIAGILAIGILGILLGVGLASASIAFAVVKDESVEAAEEILPGVNCGACGYAGCSAYANAVVKEDAEIDLCAPGGQETVVKLAELLGKSAGDQKEKMVAYAHCKGNKETSQYKFRYEGPTDCSALFLLYGGDKVCGHGCLQQGSCIKICPVDAIDYDADGNIRVNQNICISCGKCVDICPTGVMKMIPQSADTVVACNSTDKGAAVRKYCSVGCIGCKICEKKSPEGGFVVENFLARIDYSKAGDRKEAQENCPPKCIVKL